MNSLNNRIIVAGGGGGTSNDTDSKHFPGVGGGIIGGTGTGTYSSTDSGGGTQEGPGSAALDSKKGLFGSGVRSSVGANAGYGGGGGGGYWGGSTGHGKPGGGGSGYIGGVENGTTIAGSQDIPEYPKQDEGNGYARISYYGEDAAYQKGLITLYGYTGTVQTFKALNDGKYKIESWGAQGGGSIMGIDVGGKGGYTSGNIELIKDEVLYVYVGRRGYDNASITNIGGWNGGGYSGNNPGSNSYGGGGATDVRLVKASETATVWNEATSLRSRIMVAGGGGGGFSTPQFTQTAGVGGGLIGGTGTGSYANPDISSGGGTQTGAGTAYSDVKKGSFGYAPQSNGAGWGGGGGGGYWGGSTGNGKPGGGGSSYISGYKGSVAVASASSSAAKSGCTDGTTDVTCSYHYSEKIFENPKIYDGGSGFVRSPIGNDYMTGNIGDGYAKITYMGNGDVKVNDITCVAYLTKDTPIDFDHITFLTADCNDAKKNSLFAFDQNLTEQDYNVITLAAVYSFER